MWAGLSLIYSINIDGTLRYLQILIGNIIVWYLASVCIKKIYNISKLLYPLFLSFIVQLFFALTVPIVEADVIVNQGLERVKGLSSDANDLSYLLFFGLNVCVLLILHSSNKIHKLIYIGFMLLFFLGIFRAGSRSALIVGVINVALNVVLIAKRKNFIYMILILGVSLISGYFLLHYMINNTAVGLRLQIAINHGSEGEARTTLAAEGLSIFMKHPFYGVGLGSYVDFSRYRKSSHNDYIEILASLGIVAFGLYIAIFLDYFKKVRILIRKKVELTTAIVAMNFLIAYIIIGIFRPSFYYVNSILMFAFVYSWVSTTYSKIKTRSK
jgi:O-antigen ligase